MDRSELLDRARRNPAGLRFTEACALAEAYGWVLTNRRRGGSHVIFKRPGVMQLINLQMGENGMAKAYQVRQLVRAIEQEGAR